MVRDIKAATSKWIHELDVPLQNKDFEWQIGYGAFTVSFSKISAVDKYIENQEEHHRDRTFEQEYSDMLMRHGIEFAPKYLFEGEFHG